MTRIVEAKSAPLRKDGTKTNWDYLLSCHNMLWVTSPTVYCDVSDVITSHVIWITPKASRGWSKAEGAVKNV